VGTIRSQYIGVTDEEPDAPVANYAHA